MSLNHCCELQGCYVKKHTPDWGFLDNALSGKRRISDIDGIVEIKGNLLIIEWKGSRVKLPKGQEYMFINATRKNHLTVFVVNGNSERTTVENIKVYRDGELVKDIEANNDTLISYVSHWERISEQNSFKKVA